VTFVLLRIIKLFMPLRYDDDILEAGDLAIHDEQVEPPQDAHRIFEPAGYGDHARLALAGATAAGGGADVVIGGGGVAEGGGAGGGSPGDHERLEPAGVESHGEES
jgi:hypothetical protein